LVTKEESMNKTLLAMALLATIAASTAHAADWFPGQSGQYHLIPDGPDVQKLTLVGFVDASCGPSGVALYSVDEFGKRDNVPFVVPSNTVFLLTDAIFSGGTTSPIPGQTPWLNIANAGISATPKASFLASRPLVGNPNEPFAGQGSLASGGAFATNSKLCAYVDFYASTYNINYGPSSDLALSYVVVHGTLVDNKHTAYPYFNW
jgi:hypothetical protein